MDPSGATRGCHNTTKNDQESELDDDVTPSKLGTKEYWDVAYQRELETFKDIGDVGEIWFGEESMGRVIKCLEKENVPADAAILDIGTGNGVLLVELARCGFTNLTGIDYSAAAVELARNVLEQEGVSNVKVEVVDFLSPAVDLTGFDLCIDKGTFDAISLNPEDAAGAKAHYLNALKGALREGGLFIITSCNWTKDQLLHMFSQGFEFLRELPTPSFQFGGRTGNSVTALVLKRVH
ncbi:EEF1A lysine methyltransferase 2 isoform X1 [Megalops cyprinoides]|uniref:EEF1A lysine methyltransferase 2 isoform X1 n=2 Tax=Megalops cyprinoides TaxID=118141 RepID=UPI0018645E84|nr:EEF1A lysine methyltransferase 2 isoform X1 [Megalops cyprinoides]